MAEYQEFITDGFTGGGEESEALCQGNPQKVLC